MAQRTPEPPWQLPAHLRHPRSYWLRVTPTPPHRHRGNPSNQPLGNSGNGSASRWKLWTNRLFNEKEIRIDKDDRRMRRRYLTNLLFHLVVCLYFYSSYHYCYSSLPPQNLFIRTQGWKDLLFLLCSQKKRRFSRQRGDGTSRGSLLFLLGYLASPTSAPLPTNETSPREERRWADLSFFHPAMRLPPDLVQDKDCQVDGDTRFFWGEVHPVLLKLP